MWDMHDIADAAAEGLRARAAALDDEQSPYGLDAADELALHPHLQRAFLDAGFGVLPEERYPASRARPRRSEGDRCDIVLTTQPGEPLLDPLLAGTLFGHRGLHPAEALWIEVKTVHQFGLTSGVAGQNPAYSAEWLAAAASDVRKLAGEEAIAHAAVLIVAFTLDEPTIEHDVLAFAHRCLDKGFPIGAPVRRSFRIADRLGNSLASVVVVEVRKPAPS